MTCSTRPEVPAELGTLPATPPRHRRITPGKVLRPRPHADDTCIACGLPAAGHTVETWKFFDAPGDVYPLCFWCAELWEHRGLLRP